VVTVSSVLSATKLPIRYAMGTIRFSTGKNTTKQEVITAANHVHKIFMELSAAGPSKEFC